MDDPDMQRLHRVMEHDPDVETFVHAACLTFAAGLISGACAPNVTCRG